jgi:predicted RNA-binding Zn ribbon-like protein
MGDRATVAWRLREEMPRLVGGRACLDFANTAGGRGGEHPDEYLGGYARLVVWARYAGLIRAADERRLLKAAEQRPEEADQVYHRAIGLREAIYRLFSAFGRGGQPSPDDLDEVRMAHISALEHARLVASDGGARWAWPAEDLALERVLWPVVESAVALVTSGELNRVRECPGGTGPCTWLFLDVSKGGRRRWCSMAEGCGGVSKARRQTSRRRASRTNLPV